MSDPRASGAGLGTSRRRLLLMAVLVFLTMGLVWAGYAILVLAGRESTDDAYTAANQIRVASRISGTVTGVLVDNHEWVEAGQVLITLDATDARISLDRAKAELADTVRQTRALMAEANRQQALVAQREAELAKAEGNLVRRQEQRTAMSISPEELAHARDDLAIATEALREAREAWQVSRSRIRDTSLEDQPQVGLAAAKVREAYLALERCTVKSPVAGVTAKRSVQVGMQVAPGTPLLGVVPLDEVWVDANFKEVQLRHMRIGQEARVRVDLYGDKVAYTGTVAGFSAGTGASFSLLPPENATGNWIKVVQRVPVKIRLNAAEVARHPLVVGLSCEVTVSVSGAEGSLLGEMPKPGSPMLSDVPVADLQSIDREIRAIIQEHGSVMTADVPAR